MCSKSSIFIENRNNNFRASVVITRNVILKLFNINSNQCLLSLSTYATLTHSILNLRTGNITFIRVVLTNVDIVWLVFHLVIKPYKTKLSESLAQEFRQGFCFSVSFAYNSLLNHVLKFSKALVYFFLLFFYLRLFLSIL